MTEFLRNLIFSPLASRSAGGTWRLSAVAADDLPAPDNARSKSSDAAPPPTASTPSTRRSRFASLYLAATLPLLTYLLLSRLSVPDLSKLANVPSTIATSFSGAHLEGAKCPPQVDALDLGPNWDPQHDPEYVKMAVERFQGALRIPTESWDDMHIDPYQESRYDVFHDFHEYLAQAFPTVHSKLRIEKVAKYGLLITYPGKEDTKPIVLMAHQDVVPVNNATAALWTHSPYAATQDADGWIWARGTTDCKNTLVAILAAFEKLALEGFEPARPIILSSGFDEEIGGRRSAPPLAKMLEDRYGRNGVGFIIDEGISGVFDAFKQTFVVFAVAEKGFTNLKIEVHTPGGHSSVPLGTNTGIGILSKLVTTLEENAPQPNLDVGTPLLSFLSCAAEFGTVERLLQLLVRFPLSWGKLGKMLAKKHPLVKAFITTAQSVTLINGGIKMNALPEYTSANVNYRIDFLSSVNATLTHAATVLAPIVSSFNLTFDAFGTNPGVRENVVRLTTTDAIEPAPISPTHGEAWDFVAGTARQVFDNAIVGPSGMIANTDTKFYWNTTENIYRFIPGRLALMKNPHTVDERIHVDAHLETIKFFYKLAQNSQVWANP
ncbi:M20 family metallopeptidase [Sporobolomyces koalae]|uniref:M20 family metallopeptidase n=1 Tax=Sporobolomyces koalae TaxID=500713 RepID=UPI0031740E61